MKSKKIFRRKKLSMAVSVACAMMGSGIDNFTYAQDTKGGLEEITVTGSRITKRDLSAPSPVMTVGAEAFENSSTISIESVLNELPQFAPGDTQFGAGAADVQSSASNTPGASTLNLRGLGPNRNLVLINGKRPQPSNATLVVDINTIPASAIQSVEIISGGASAVYGADAMAGVVNFILKDDFQGIELDYQTGQTGESDGAENKFSILVGANADEGRGNIMIGMDWYKRDAVLQRDRDFFVNGWMDPANGGGGFMNMPSYAGGQGGPTIAGGTNLPSQAVVDSLFPQAPAGSVGRNSEFRFNQDGTIFVTKQGYGYNGPLNCLDCGNFSMVKKLSNGDLLQNVTTGYLSAPMERHSIFMSGDYDITDNISGFLQGNYVKQEIKTRGGIPPAVTIWQAPIPRDGRALPANLNTLLDSRTTPAGDWSLYQVMNFSGPIDAIHTNDVWQIMGGLRGELMNDDWSWELYYSRGQTDVLDENENLISLQRYQFLVSRPNFGRGVNFASSLPGYQNSGRGYNIDCPTGLPIFASFVPDPECERGIDSRMLNQSTLTQDIIEGNLQGGFGNWFKLPAGEVLFSVGGTYRENEFKFHPGNDGSETIFDNPIGIFSNASTSGYVDVTEGYFELLIPVLEKLEVEGGYRYSNYNTAGGVSTWKGLGTWEARDWLTFRGGYQFATRAPNINELFAANTLTVVAHPDQDPCSVTTLSSWGNVPGNPDRLQVQALCRAIIGNSTSGFDTQTYSITGISGPSGFHRQTPPFFPLEIAIFKGNADLGVEEGKTWTVGTVISNPFDGMFNHDWLNNLTLVVDFYHIELADTIAPISVATVYNNCMNYNGVSNPTYDVNNSFCRMIRRDPTTGDRAEVDAPFFNLGSTQTVGVDMQLDWSHDLGPGSFGIHALVNYLDLFEYQAEQGGVVNDATGTLGGFAAGQGSNYDYKTNTTFSYTWNDFYIGMNWRHLPSIESEAAATNPNTTTLGAGVYNIFDMGATYNWDRYSFRVGVDNLLDEDIVVVGAIPGVDSNTDATNGNYDQLGRRWYIGVKATF
ncbi:MAG: TonB-dependent receptor [Gammaproteobacteria bacterium]|nr:TonB-dependent receptor [Gammaproteobacteria bacterium]